MRIREAAFYDSVVLSGMINFKETIKYSLVRFLFQQQEFKHTLENVDQGYFRESEKFRMILKTKSAFVFWLFVKFVS